LIDEGAYPSSLLFGRGTCRLNESFSPKLTVLDALRHLAHLRLVGEGIVDPGFSGFGQFVPFDMVLGPVRRVDALVLQALLDAIRRRQEIEIIYQSMSRPEPDRPWIAPHALAFDGFRWHVRA